MVLPGAISWIIGSIPELFNLPAHGMARRELSGLSGLDRKILHAARNCSLEQRPVLGLDLSRPRT